MQPRDIGWAVARLKEGKAVQRIGWNGRGMFLFLLPAGDGLPTKIIHDPALRAVVERELGGDTFDALASVRMFTADKKILTGWNASTPDLLATDWQDYEPAPSMEPIPVTHDGVIIDDLDEPLGERPAAACEGDTCESCQ